MRIDTLVHAQEASSMSSPFMHRDCCPINTALYTTSDCYHYNNSKGLHLSEDIFAGFNWVLRGGRSSQLDYIQAGKVCSNNCILLTYKCYYHMKHCFI
jgi:1,3-beta-glucan synthase component